ncbi:hypothetical protein ABMC88_13085 [Sulfitobacter sp. HNIBRBA2951]|uniref:hypothetical protein n=1 Tax=Sulfitobacter aquimarinus TaxID=3158557 RepID=UPI0032DECFC0
MSDPTEWADGLRVKQGKDRLCDPQPLMTNGRQFTLGSGAPIWTAYEVMVFWVLANGYAPMLTWAALPVWSVALSQVIPIRESFCFHWIHRLLHLPRFYKHGYGLHHQMHHRYFACHYGALEIRWNRLFGSSHDGTAAADAKIKERRKKRAGS